MPVEVQMLFWVLLLLFALLLSQVLTIISTYGLFAGVGNREDFPAVKPGFGGRLDRSVQNLKENLLFFIPLVLLTVILNVSNPMTVLGAQLFAGGRVAHALIYMIGIPWLRTLAFMVAVAGIFIMAFGLGFPGVLFS